MPMVRVSNGGTVLGSRAFYTTSSTGWGNYTIIDNNTVSSGAINLNSSVTLTNDITFSMNGSYVVTAKFLTAGSYNINGTWKTKTVNSTETIQMDQFVYWYGDRKRH